VLTDLWGPDNSRRRACHGQTAKRYCGQFRYNAVGSAGRAMQDRRHECAVSLYDAWSASRPNRQGAGSGRCDGKGHGPYWRPKAYRAAQAGHRGATLATKSDIELLRKDVEGVRLLPRAISSCSGRTSRGCVWPRKRYRLAQKDVEGVRLAAKSDIELLRASMTIRLGSMLVVGLGILLGALRWVITNR